MNTTKSKAAYQIYRQENQAAFDKYRRAILTEFKPGMAVRYQHGLKWIEAVVVSVAECDFSDDVTIRNIKTGVSRKVSGRDLEFAPAAEKGNQ